MEAEQLLAGGPGRVRELTGGERLQSVLRLWPWFPLLLLAVYGGLLLFDLPAIVRATYSDADAASGQVIGELLHAGHGDVNLGQLAWYSTLIFELGTRWLPAHRLIWELAPFAMALASALLIAGSVRVVAGRWAGAIALAVLVCASPELLHVLSSLNDHSPSWFSLALLGGWIVFLEHSRRRLHWLALALAAGVIGLVLGMNAASDELLMVSALPALVAAPLVALARSPGQQTRRAMLWALVTAAALIAADVITGAVMHGEFHQVGQPTFAAPGSVLGNLALWIEGVGTLGSGTFYGSTIGFTSLLGLTGALVVWVGLAISLYWVWRTARNWLGLGTALSSGTTARLADVTPSAWAGDGDGLAAVESATRMAFVTFWGSVLVILSLAFILGSNPVDLNSARYLPGVYYSVVALVTTLVMGRGLSARVLLTVAASVVCLAGVDGLARNVIVNNASSYTTRAQAQTIAHIAHEYGLERGYGPYWDSADITWQSNYAAKVFPVSVPCGGDAASACIYPLHTVAAWYRPEPGTKSFFITDPGQKVPWGFGKPVASFTVGSLTMWVFNDDIAAKLLP